MAEPATSNLSTLALCQRSAISESAEERGLASEFRAFGVVRIHSGLFLQELSND